MKNMVEMINVEQGAITRHVGEMSAGMTGEEVRDIVRREVVDVYLTSFNSSMVLDDFVMWVSICHNLG